MDVTRPPQSAGSCGPDDASKVVIDPIYADADHRIISALIHNQAQPLPKQLRRQQAVADLSAHILERVRLETGAHTRRNSSVTAPMTSPDCPEAQNRRPTHDVSTGYFPSIPEKYSPATALRFAGTDHLPLLSDSISKYRRPSRTCVPLPNPLHSHALRTKPVGDVLIKRRHARVQRGGDMRYARRFRNMSILSTLDEALEEVEDLSSAPVMAINHTPDHVPLHKPRPIPCVQYLTETDRSPQAESRLLNAVRRNAVSQRIMTAGQLQQLQQLQWGHGAAREGTNALCTVETPANPELQKISTILGICDQARGFEQSSSSSSSSSQSIAEQTRHLGHDECGNLIACQRMDRLTVENQRLRSQLDNIQAEQQNLRARLDIAEERAARVEKYHIQYPRV